MYIKFLEWYLAGNIHPKSVSYYHFYDDPYFNVCNLTHGNMKGREVRLKKKTSIKVLVALYNIIPTVIIWM